MPTQPSPVSKPDSSRTRSWARLYSTSEKRETEYFIDSAELGFKDINGTTPGSITSLRIDRLDDGSRLSPGSGRYVAPYMNF